MTGLIKSIILFLTDRKRKADWKSNNRHNFAVIGNADNLEYINVGIGTYGCINALMHRDKSHLNIGNYCSIADNVCFVVCSDHPLQLLSTFPFKTIS